MYPRFKNTSPLTRDKYSLACFNYLMLIIKPFIWYNKVKVNLNTLCVQLLDGFLLKTYFIGDYYRLNDQIWQDGFLIDFLQKKFLDKWIRRFLIISSYLFNERVVFDRIIRVYADLIIWTGNRNNIFEFNNVSSTLFITNLTLIATTLLISLNYWFIVFLL